jgi:TolA-binding protein
MMSFFDKVTKAVGDVVDRGKAEVDQFMRIQKINGEIGEMEKKIAECKTQIQTATQQAGEKAIALVRSGTIAPPDLKAFVDQITGFEQQIAAEQAAVAGKKKEIEAIKAEDEAAEAKAAEATAAPPVPASAAPVAAAPAAKVCSACGASLAGAGAFCPLCGAKQG